MYYKNLKTAAKGLLLACLFMLNACNQNSSDDNNPSNPTGGTPATGNWRVSYFWDKQDETAHFNGYTFDFAANGALNAALSSQNWAGSWATGVDDSSDKFIIAFPGTVPSPLEEISEDWVIIKMTDTFMHFEHTSGGNGDTDVLKFEKL